MGMTGDDGITQIIDGLAEGEIVVVSGQFLIDSESRIREAIQKFVMHKDHGASTTSTQASDATSREQQLSSDLAAVPLDAPSQQRLDAAVSAYLELARTLGAPQASASPVDPQSLLVSVKNLGELAGDDAGAHVKTLATATEGLAGKTIDQQREQFKSVSRAMLDLIGSHPPSRAVAERVYIVHCPMAPGDWLQTTDQIANPFYSTSMKQCGEVVRTIVPAEGPHP